MTLDEGRRKYGFSRAADCIVLDDEGFSWTSRDKPRRRAYGDVRAIRLQCVRMHRATIGICHIDFADGLILRLRNVAGRFGRQSAGTTDMYRRFVADLHDGLRLHGDNAVAFRGGNTQERQTVAVAALTVAGILFILVPTVLGIIAAAPSLIVAAASCMLVSIIPLFRMAMNNRPTIYAPDDIPPELMP
jgi:hypothetical protein